MKAALLQRCCWRTGTPGGRRDADREIRIWLINNNAAARTDFEPGIFSQHSFWFHSDRQDDEISRQARTALCDDDQTTAAARFDACQPVAQMELYTFRGEVVHQRHRHLRVERRHDLGQLLQHRDGSSRWIKFSTISKPMKPPPTTTAVLAL